MARMKDEAKVVWGRVVDRDLDDILESEGYRPCDCQMRGPVELFKTKGYYGMRCECGLQIKLMKTPESAIRRWNSQWEPPDEAAALAVN